MGGEEIFGEFEGFALALEPHEHGGGAEGGTPGVRVEREGAAVGVAGGGVVGVALEAGGGGVPRVRFGAARRRVVEGQCHEPSVLRGRRVLDGTASGSGGGDEAAKEHGGRPTPVGKAAHGAVPYLFL